MPTGYTAGIIDGKTKTFKQYASHCMRAFGACVHMRDEPFDAKYKPEKPSTYHSDELARLNKEHEELILATDEQILKSEQERIATSNKYHNESILKTIETVKRLNTMLDKARSFQAPTEEHTGVKDFMIQQIEDTLKWDGDYSYHTKGLKANVDALLNIDAERIRAEKFQQIQEDISRHTQGYMEEVRRSEERNKWVEQFLKAIK